MSNRVLVFILLFSFFLIAMSLYIIKTLDPGVKPKPTSEVMNVAALNVKVNDHFKLKFADGKDFTFSNLQNKFTLIYFGFAHCPDVCPITLQKMKEAIDLLTVKEVDQTQFIFVSIDPIRDTMDDLQKFTTQFGAHIKAATGTQVELDKLALSLKAYYAKAGDEGDDYYVDHSSFVYLLDSKAELVSQFTPEISAEEMAKQIKMRIMQQK